MSEEIRAVVERFNGVLNRHDIAELADLLTDDCVFEDTGPPDGNRHIGKDAVLKAMEQFFAESPEAHFDDEEVVVMGDRAVVRWRYSWPGGHVRGIDLIRVRDGRIAESVAYVKG